MRDDRADHDNSESFRVQAHDRWYNTSVHLRRGFLLAALLILASCGVTGDDLDAASTTTAPTSTAPPTTADDPDGTEPEKDPTPTTVPELTDRDLAEALPTEDDVPDDFAEIDLSEELSEDDPFLGDDPDAEAETEAGPECEPVLDLLDTLVLDTEVLNGFGNVDEVEVITSIAVAGRSERDVFDRIDEIASCTSYRDVYESGEVDTYTLSTRRIDLGEAGFAVDVTVSFEGVDEPAIGFTTISVLHGDVVYTVDVYDGFSSTGTIPRDPALATTVAEAVDAKVGEVQAD